MQFEKHFLKHYVKCCAKCQLKMKEVHRQKVLDTTRKDVFKFSRRIRVRVRKLSNQALKTS